MASAEPGDFGIDPVLPTKCHEHIQALGRRILSVLGRRGGDKLIVDQQGSFRFACGLRLPSVIQQGRGAFLWIVIQTVPDRQPLIRHDRQPTHLRSGEKVSHWRQAISGASDMVHRTDMAASISGAWC